MKWLSAQALGWLDSFVKDRKFMAGNSLTIADISLLATYSTIKATGVSIFTRNFEILFFCKSTS
jgi:glutathione S-transferase